eukprot:10919389-Alexandrium_andersonii.AAC.1
MVARRTRTGASPRMLAPAQLRKAVSERTVARRVPPVGRPGGARCAGRRRACGRLALRYVLL